MSEQEPQLDADYVVFGCDEDGYNLYAVGQGNNNVFFVGGDTPFYYYSAKMIEKGFSSLKIIQREWNLEVIIEEGSTRALKVKR